MIRFNQIAWPDIALLFDSRGRNARTTHFTACPCVCVCVCVFFHGSAEMVERASPAQNDSKRVSNFIEFRGIRRFICFGEVRWKKRGGRAGGM